MGQEEYACDDVTLEYQQGSHGNESIFALNRQTQCRNGTSDAVCVCVCMCVCVCVCVCVV